MKTAPVNAMSPPKSIHAAGVIKNQNDGSESVLGASNAGESSRSSMEDPSVVEPTTRRLSPVNNEAVVSAKVAAVKDCKTTATTNSNVLRILAE
ncbi:MAG: hypothetical protein ACREKL_05190 [Chthoniobacterales bacterium]